MRLLPSCTNGIFAYINGHFRNLRNLNWRYLPYIKAYVWEYPHTIWPYMVKYLHSRILKFPLTIDCIEMPPFDQNQLPNLGAFCACMAQEVSSRAWGTASFLCHVFNWAISEPPLLYGLLDMQALAASHQLWESCPQRVGRHERIFGQPIPRNPALMTGIVYWWH